MQNILEDNPVRISTVKLTTVAAGTDEELAVFVAPFDCFIKEIRITDDAGVAVAATNYTTISFQAKGIAGSGSDEIGSVNTNTGGTALTARVPVNIGILDTVFRYVPKNSVVTGKKVDTGTGKALTDALISVEYVRA